MPAPNIIWKAVCTAVLIPVTVICTGLAIFFPNSNELGLHLHELFPLIGQVAGIAALVLFGIQLPFAFLRNKNGFTLFNSVLLAFGILLWVQGNVFVWKFGEFDGSGIDWQKFQLHAWAEIIVWIVVLSAAVVRCRLLSKYVIHITLILVCVQLLPSLNFIRRYYKHGDIAPQQYELTLNNFFDYSKTDVYLFVLDGLGAEIFEKCALTSSESPSFLCDFTYFSKCFVPFPVDTLYSIPRILTGCDTTRKPLNSLQYQTEAFSEKYALIDTLFRNGYKCNAYSWAPRTMFWNPQTISNIRTIPDVQLEQDKMIHKQQISGLTLFRLVPTHFKQIFYSKLVSDFGTAVKSISPDSDYLPLGNLTDPVFWDKMKNAEWKNTPGQKHFKFIHLQGPHYPYVMNEDGKLEQSGDYNSELRQAQGTLKIIESFIEQLKSRDAYHNAFIVVMSDHGPHSGTEYVLNRSSVYHPLLLVKRPDEHHDILLVNKNPVHIKDTTPSILTELKLECPDDAFSWFSMPPELSEKRNREWEAYWAKSGNLPKKLQFQPKQETLGTKIDLKRKHVLFSDNTVRVDLLGGESDAMETLRTEKMCIVLIGKEQYAAQGNPSMYVSEPCRIREKYVKALKKNVWCTAAELYFPQVSDGQHDIVIVFSDKKGKPYWASLECSVTVAGGSPQKVNRTDR